MAKYFVAYPISYDCNLRCDYCFHREHHENNYAEKRIFTVSDWCRFRDTHLKDAEDILVHFHGGETFLPTNINTICSFMRQTTMERVDFLTNGIQDPKHYRRMLEFNDRIHRIGFTFHRKMIRDVPQLVEAFERNVYMVRDMGIPLYVKELLFVDLRDETLEAKRRWESEGIQFKIQDFKGYDRGRDFAEFQRYEARDYLYIDSEYKRGGAYCACVKGYKNILIRGHWNDGDVLACFEDGTVVGNIQQNWYHPGYKVYKDFDKGRIDVIGVPKLYRGTYDRDLYKPGQCGSN
ncbi:MAG: 4Fe-4S cluster-binding domain-containing protein [Candidatus Altiarchaeales archaeon]|nr:4Fe-4S cluster-binding domain-containing protein [Candidatus Altiarchaeales archaeon]